MKQGSAAQVYALVIGVVLVVAGVLGFFYESAFTSDESVRGSVLGILEVNGWHNVVHLLTGAAGLVLMGSYEGARAYVYGLGAVYIVVGIWGLILGNHESILGIVPVNTEDNILHLLIGVGGFWAGAITSPQPSPTTMTTM